MKVGFDLFYINYSKDVQFNFGLIEFRKNYSSRALINYQNSLFYVSCSILFINYYKRK